MKVVDLKCHKCGGNIKRDENNILSCSYCGANYVLDVPTPNTVINNTTINHYGTSLQTDANFSGEKQYSDKEDTKMKKKLLVGLAALIFFLFFIFKIISFLQFPKENEAFTVAEGTKPKDVDYSQVTKIVYESYQEDDEMFQNITKMTNLEELHLHNASVLEDYSFLSRFPKLKILSITDANGLDHLDFIKNLKSLKTLEITKSNITDLSLLKDNLSIRELILSDNEKITDYSVISTLKSLEKLDIRANPSGIAPDTSHLEYLKEENFVYSK